MMIHEITPKAGAHKRRKRIGRGHAAGQGKTAGRGHNGFGSRSGNSAPHEGGRIPFYKRFPKRGFTNAAFKKHFEVVNIKHLDAVLDDGTQVDADVLAKVGLIRSAKSNVKVLGYGETSKKFSLQVAAISETARKKIETAGGSVAVPE